MILPMCNIRGKIVKTKLFGAALVAAVLSSLPAQAETGRNGQPSVTPEQLAAAQSTWIFTFSDSVAAKDVKSAAENAARRVNGRVQHVYSSAIKGFSARMNAVAAQRLRDQNPQIVAVEQDQIVKTMVTPAEAVPIASTAPYGTVRVRGQVCGRPYSRVWVIDTGIDLDHPDLSVADGLSFTAIGTSADDGNGHGTHVAGTIGARAVGTSARGVAPGVPVVPVRVLDANGSGAWSGVLAGIDYVAQQKVAACALADKTWCNSPEAWVANMSLGGGYSLALNNAVISAASKGIRFAIAAGNSRADARNSSPASANHVNIFTVAAINSSDGWASFSNYGSPVDVAAPGVSVTSTYIGGGYATLSGTSMASPHVAGILTLAPGLLSNPSSTQTTTALKIGSTSYTDKRVYRNTKDSYPIGIYAGTAPQTVVPGADPLCTYMQPVLP